MRDKCVRQGLDGLRNYGLTWRHRVCPQAPCRRSWPDRRNSQAGVSQSRQRQGWCRCLRPLSAHKRATTPAQARPSPSGDLWRPLAMLAKARKSSMRPLVVRHRGNIVDLLARHGFARGKLHIAKGFLIGGGGWVGMFSEIPMPIPGLVP